MDRKIWLRDYARSLREQQERDGGKPLAVQSYRYTVRKAGVRFFDRTGF